MRMITHQVLGKPGGDNALLVTIDSGQSLHRLLFDCGEGCLSRVKPAYIQTLDGVFFSHFHVDHIGGFDSFMRMNFYRETDAPQLYGPAGAFDILQHRLQGCTWNLVENSRSEMQLYEIDGGKVSSCTLKTAEGFSERHKLTSRPFSGVLVDNNDYTVQACPLPHGVVSMGYRVTEKPRRNIDLDAVAAMGLRPGPWLQSLKDPTVSDSQQIETGDAAYSAGRLREKLMNVKPGDSIAYLTDFRLDTASRPALLHMLRGCRLLVCENQYRNADEELAAKNFHMVARDAAQLAVDAQAEELVIFHVSSRYTPAGWAAQLAEVCEVFPAASYPPHWRMTQ